VYVCVYYFKFGLLFVLHLRFCWKKTLSHHIIFSVVFLNIITYTAVYHSHFRKTIHKVIIIKKIKTSLHGELTLYHHHFSFSRYLNQPIAGEQKYGSCAKSDKYNVQHLGKRTYGVELIENRMDTLRGHYAFSGSCSSRGSSCSSSCSSCSNCSSSCSGCSSCSTCLYVVTKSIHRVCCRIFTNLSIDTFLFCNDENWNVFKREKTHSHTQGKWSFLFVWIMLWNTSRETLIT